MKLFWNGCLFWVLLALLTACGSIRPNKPVFEPERAIEIPPMTGSVNLPVKVQLATLETVLDFSVQEDFCDSVSKCQGFSYQYSFHREQFKLSSNSDGISVRLPGQYSAFVSFCPKCITYRRRGPRCVPGVMEFDCGMDESMRRVVIDFSSRLKLAKNYQLISQTTVNRVDAIDPCEITFLKLDASKIFEKQLLSALNIAAGQLDHLIANIDLKDDIEKGWRQLNREIPINDVGYLYLNPQEVRVDPLTFADNAIGTNIQIQMRPEFSSAKRGIHQTQLPYISGATKSPGIQIPIASEIGFKQINAHIKDHFTERELTIRKRKIVLTKIKIVGGNDGKAIFSVAFTGWREGVIYLTGTPVFDPETRTIQFPDMSFDIQTKSLLLNSAKWLYSEKLTDKIRTSIQIPIGAELDKIKLNLTDALNQEFPIKGTDGLKLSGQINELNFSDLVIGRDKIEFLLFIQGVVQATL